MRARSKDFKFEWGLELKFIGFHVDTDAIPILGVAARLIPASENEAVTRAVIKYLSVLLARVRRV